MHDGACKVVLNRSDDCWRWRRTISLVLLITFLHSLFSPIFAVSFAADDLTDEAGKVGGGASKATAKGTSKKNPTSRTQTRNAQQYLSRSPDIAQIANIDAQQNNQQLVAHFNRMLLAVPTSRLFYRSENTESVRLNGVFSLGWWVCGAGRS